jgi:hypothetical protein
MHKRFHALHTSIALGILLLLPLTTQAQIDNWYRVEVMIFSYPGGGATEQWEATPDLAYPEASRFLILPGEQAVATHPAGPAGVAAASAVGSTADVATGVALPAQPTPFAALPKQQREFSSKADSMQRSGRYRILFHEAWLQPMTSQSGSLPIVLDRSGDGGKWPELQGSITVYMSSDIYLDSNLWLNTQGEYLHSAWSMPPPPLGPTATAAVAATAPSPLGQPGETTAGRQEFTTGGIAQGAVYPFKHAVLLQQTRRMQSGEVSYIDHPMLGLVAKITSLSETESPTATEADVAIPQPPEPKPVPST